MPTIERIDSTIDLDCAHLLVTGGAGFMGANFIHHLLKRMRFSGFISNLDQLTYAANRSYLSSIEGDSRYQFIVGDIRDTVLLEKIHRERPIDVIVHFAAETHVDRSIANPTPFIDTNVVGTCRLLEFVRRFPSIHFHHVSTDEVYGTLGDTGQFTKESPYRPNSPYAASKAAADHFVRAYSQTYGISSTLSHACNNYGPSQFPEKFIPLMIINSLQKKELPIYGSGENRRDWLYVEDHSRAIATILQKGSRGCVYNIGSGKEISNFALLQLLLELLAKKTEKSVEQYQKQVTFVPDRPGHDFRYVLSAKEMVELGWHPSTSLQEGLEKTITWYQEQLDKGCSLLSGNLVGRS